MEKRENNFSPCEIQSTRCSHIPVDLKIQNQPNPVINQVTLKVSLKGSMMTKRS